MKKKKRNEQQAPSSGPMKESQGFIGLLPPPPLPRQLSELLIDSFGSRFPGLVRPDGEISWELYASLTEQRMGKSSQLKC
jgi:hypothetical protein